MKRTLVTLLIGLSAILTVSGNRGTAAQSGNAQVAQDGSFLSLPEVTGDEVREEFHQTYALSANGRVGVENINGAVRIAVWDQNQVKVDAVKRAYRRDRLDEAKIDVTATPDSVRIKTDYPDRDQVFTDEEGRRNNNPATVEYSLTIPRHARLDSIEVINGSLDIDGAEGDVKASSINGHVKAQALTGEVRLSTVNGPLEATFTRLEGARPVSLTSVNGNIVLVIPSDANAQLRASTVHGGISNEFGLTVIDGEYIGHEMNGQVGAGGPRIKLGSVNGRITVKHAADGRTLSSATSLNAEKDKSDKSKSKTRRIDDDVRESTRQDREIANVQAEVQRAVAESQREVERAIRESQREVQRAQAQIQREVQQAQRDAQRQIRVEVRENVGLGAAIGRGMGRGGGRFMDRESQSFPVNGTPNVSATTFDGPVVVHAWDKAEVMYTAIKRANRDEDLKKITIESNQQSQSITIKARSPEDFDGSTALEIYVPRNANLRLSSGDGSLTVQGVSGELVAHSGDGVIDVEGGNGRIEANTGDGRIRIANFQGNVEARTGDGTITLEGTFTAIQARTGDGSIVLGVPAGSNFVIETDAESLTNEGLTITEETAPTARVKRFKVGNGGVVFKMNTGDGHIILRPR